MAEKEAAESSFILCFGRQGIQMGREGGDQRDLERLSLQFNTSKHHIFGCRFLSPHSMLHREAERNVDSPVLLGDLSLCPIMFLRGRPSLSCFCVATRLRCVSAWPPVFIMFLCGRPSSSCFCVAARLRRVSAWLPVFVMFLRGRPSSWHPSRTSVFPWSLGLPLEASGATGNLD